MTVADTSVLDVRSLSCGYNEVTVLSDVSLSVSEGEVLVMIGPNGVGKSTLFKTVLGLLPKISGEIRVCGEDTTGWSRRRLARLIAYVPQVHDVTFSFSVREMVLMGRTPNLNGFASSPGQADERIVDEVLESLGITALAERDCCTLSGGELQMVLIARSLAQQPRLLMMDEPCANLDLGNQTLILQRISRLADDGLGVIVTSHDPNHAFQLEANVFAISMNGQTFCGQAQDILTPDVLGSLYGVEVGVGSIDGRYGQHALTCVPFLKQQTQDALDSAHGDALDSAHGDTLDSAHGDALDSAHGDALDDTYEDALDDVHRTS